MTRPLKEVYSFYLSLVVQFIEIWGNKHLSFRDLLKFSRQILSEMKTSSDDWKRVMNYYQVYAETTAEESSAWLFSGKPYTSVSYSKLASICNTTLLMHYDIIMFHSLRDICRSIEKESRENLNELVNSLKERMDTRYYCAEDIDGDPNPDPYGIKDAAFAIYLDRRESCFPNIGENDQFKDSKILVSEGKCDYIGRARYCAYFMNSIRLDDRELLLDPKWKPECLSP